MPQEVAKEQELHYFIFTSDWEKVQKGELDFPQVTYVNNPDSTQIPVTEIVVESKEERDKERTNSIVGAMLGCR